jgi:hypothetical protein
MTATSDFGVKYVKFFPLYLSSSLNSSFPLITALNHLINVKRIGVNQGYNSTREYSYYFLFGREDSYFYAC